MRMLLVLLLLTVPASAQVVRDAKGNLLGYYEQQGQRTILRDPQGNPHGYSESHNGVIEQRDNSGNLIRTIRPR